MKDKGRKIRRNRHPSFVLRPLSCRVGPPMSEMAGETSVSGAPTLQDFLRIVAEKGGTDLHISAESAPVMRVNGELRPLPFPPLSANDTKQLCYSVLTETQKHRFEE